MVSEEGKELRANDLADSFAGLYVFLRQNWMFLILIIALAILAFELYKIHQTNVLDTQRQAWAQLDEYQTPQDLQKHVISKFSIPAVQAQAYVKIGDFYLTLVNLGNPPKIAGVTATKPQALRGAAMAFRKVIQNFSNQPLTYARAKLGLAQVYEDRGQWAKAKAIYKSMLTPDASPVEKSLAVLIEYRLHRLNQWAQPVLIGYAPAKKPALPPTNGPSAKPGAKIAPSHVPPASLKPTSATTQP